MDTSVRRWLRTEGSPTMTRLTQTRSIRILGVVVALAASSAAACSTAASVTPQPATATQTARPSGPLPIRAGLATPGSYNTTAFRPPLTLTITSDGWLFRFEDDDDEMAVGRGDGVEILGGRVSRWSIPGRTRASTRRMTWSTGSSRIRSSTPNRRRRSRLQGSLVNRSTSGPRVELTSRSSRTRQAISVSRPVRVRGRGSSPMKARTLYSPDWLQRGPSSKPCLTSRPSSDR